MIKKVLVANRGEIARRIFRTCRSMGLGTVAVFSEADARAPFVSEADEGFALGGNTPAESYLRIDRLIEAARVTGADAIHPGYGFLSENAAFAQAVIDAGLTWIGPTPESITAMGSKLEAKRLVEAAGVPTLASIDLSGLDRCRGRWRRRADRFPGFGQGLGRRRGQRHAHSSRRQRPGGSGGKRRAGG